MTKPDPKHYLERLESGLVPIAGAQHLVCRTCRSGANTRPSLHGREQDGAVIHDA